MALPYNPRLNDTWLTPPELLKELMVFDLDPCCPSKMPWVTAKTMLHYPKENGLKMPWFGRVWCNPPYSRPFPWCDKFFKEAKQGMMLLPARSSDSKWGQLCLNSADSIFYFSGRVHFHFENGVKSTGGVTPHMLVARSEIDTKILIRLQKKFTGVLMTKLER